VCISCTPHPQLHPTVRGANTKASRARSNERHRSCHPPLAVIQVSQFFFRCFETCTARFGKILSGPRSIARSGRSPCLASFCLETHDLSAVAALEGSFETETSVAFHNYGYVWFGRAAFPSSQRRGGCATNKMARSHRKRRRRGGAKREADRAKP